jgi:diguanylate cyclase (GGDEF)-like protein
MTWQPDDALSALLNELLERHTQLFRQQIAEHHRAIELRHSARGTLFTPQPVDEIRRMLHEAFLRFAEDVTAELLDAVKGQDGTASNDAATWVRQLIEPVLVSALHGVIDEPRGSSLNRDNVKTGLHDDAATMIAGARRSLAIAIGRVTGRRRGAGQVNAAPDLASTDDLVKLKNRRGFAADVARMLTEASAAAEPLALVRIDVDDFKRVNDHHGGHAVGDEALVAIGAVLRACVRRKGEAYRVGGDEFVMLLPNHMTDEAAAVAERVRRTINGRPLTSRSLSLSVSVGVAIYPDHASDAMTLAHAADQASYEAKNRGRNLVRVFGAPD